jgi:sugar phosphate permease
VGNASWLIVPRRGRCDHAAVRTLHYAWIIVGVTFVVLLVAAGVRAAPGALVKPLEAEFGWDRASISLAAAVSLLTYGLGGPLGGTLVGRLGVRRVMLGGLLLIGLGVTPLLLLRELWQLHLLWGLIAGIGTGAVAQVLGAAIATTWFRRSRGVVLGLFGAATSAGQLIFLPALVALTVWFDWRAAIVLMAVAVAVLLIPVLALIRDRPEQVGVRPYGETGEEDEATLAANAAEDARATPLREAIRSRDYQLLAASFFVCGYTSTGLIGVHFIPHAVEHGFAEVTAAGALGVMGMMNVVGTVSSGWLTDRYDNRVLLAAYYGFRALSLLFLPWIIDVPPLLVFAVVFGLDYIATVPPTANLTAQIFGRASVGTLFGWIFFAHMVGAALAAYLGGIARDALGDYTLAFLSAGALGLVAVGFSLAIRRRQPAYATSEAT